MTGLVEKDSYASQPFISFPVYKGFVRRTLYKNHSQKANLPAFNFRFADIANV
ncbi:MAG TPA: hypothetical protein VNN73_01150 [Blastocatellia bacterium]|nr:hypothetical protein [Blastocatellia bacterium]